MGGTMSFESVVSRFRAYARSVYLQSEEGPEVPFPFPLESIRPVIEHHLAPLIIVARSDHELLADERDVIVNHCRGVLRQRRNQLLSAQEISMLEDFIERFSPNLSQLDAALHKFEIEGQDEFANLLEAAESVILADDVVREGERNQLAEIKKLFDQLKSKS
jgi:hypothetical protein